MPAVTNHSDNEASKSKSKAKSAPVEDNGAESESDGGEGGSEYEIEEVLDAKRGYFPDGRMGYFVKWKGYSHNDNSWVDELDAGNAIDLVNEYWRLNPGKRKGAAPRKSVEKKSSPKKARKSAAPDDTSDAETVSTKKRGRKSAAAKKLDSDEEMEVDEVAETRAPKKARKSQASKPKPREKTPEEEGKIIGNMHDYMHMKIWEGLVKSVDTVERESEDGQLVVYFTLTTGEAVKEESTICKERFPRKLLDFYESNLRWRSVEEKSP
ncbi:hypothetical protein HYPSUDRAFT_37143 [Hypholoma sublateritium FD-334 SS-4]|uniref:Chromo domain-containing protein n=1 Tax=Hypholoma sublateritium (strain FD-334 SS-4) TaxID=945553 RepID=A0A0D2PAX8_HYPSF|nr:hypothetical protein HYPSUDRAFT_37143 [Hypholoma sublateritium FD-334 SS-4]